MKNEVQRAPSTELFVFENRKGELCVRLSMEEEVGCPVTLTEGEAIAFVRWMVSISRRCEKWSQRSSTQVLPHAE